MASYECIIVETKGRVGLVRLNRPQALNALNAQVIRELGSALDAFEADENINCMVITGTEKAFAAGADIKEMQSKSFMQVYKEDFISKWASGLARRKPVIAAVAGFALGGGCELAMMCDFIIAADTAKFGQPEIKLGVMPGAGGTQRLTRVRRQVEGDGNVPHRPHDGCRRGRAERSRLQGRARRQAARRGNEDGRDHRGHVAAHS